MVSTWIWEGFYVPEDDLNRTLAAMLLPNVLFLLFFILFYKLIHRRSALSLLNTVGFIRWRKLFISIILTWLLLMLLDLILAILFKQTYTFHWNLNSFLILLFLSVSLVPFQTLAEEILFRSYLFQGFFKASRSVLAGAFICSLLFALLHSLNPEFEKYGYINMFLYFLVMALFFSYLTLKDQGIEQVWGIHLANNVYGILIVGYEDSVLKTDSLLKIQNQSGVTMLIVSFIFIATYIFIFLTFIDKTSDKTIL